MSRKYAKDKTKKFMWCGNEDFIVDIKADLTMSLNVIYHLIEDDTYHIYMKRLFSSSKKYVYICSCNFDKSYANHIKCRKFTDYIKNYKKFLSLFFIVIIQKKRGEMSILFDEST